MMWYRPQTDLAKFNGFVRTVYSQPIEEVQRGNSGPKLPHVLHPLQQSIYSGIKWRNQACFRPLLFLAVLSLLSAPIPPLTHSALLLRPHLPQLKESLAQIHQMIQTLMWRHTKQHIDKETAIPPVSSREVAVQLSGAEMHFYNSCLQVGGRSDAGGPPLALIEAYSCPPQPWLADMRARAAWRLAALRTESG